MHSTIHPKAMEALVEAVNSAHLRLAVSWGYVDQSTYPGQQLAVLTWGDKDAPMIRVWHGAIENKDGWYIRDGLKFEVHKMWESRPESVVEDGDVIEDEETRAYDAMMSVIQTLAEIEKAERSESGSGL